MGAALPAPKPPAQPPKRPGLMAAANLGVNFAAGMAVFSYLGYWLDKRRGGGVAWTLAGLVLGLIYGGYETWKVVRALGREDQRRDPPA